MEPLIALDAADRLAISQVIARYCHATDAGDGPATAAQFTPDGILEITGAWQARGHDQISQIGSFPNKPKHWVNSIVIEGTGSSATSTVYYAAVRGGGGLLATGRYDSKLTKQFDGEWKLVHHCYTGDPVEAPAAASVPSDTGVLNAEDRVAIIELIGRYNNAIDSREAEAWADTFVSDGEFHIGDRAAIVGRDALVQMVGDMAPPDARHWTTNYIIEGAEDSTSGSARESLCEGRVRCYLAMVRKDAFVTTGAYEDTVRKVDGEWRFVRRHVVIDPVPE